MILEDVFNLFVDGLLTCLILLLNDNSRVWDLDTLDLIYTNLWTKVEFTSSKKNKKYSCKDEGEQYKYWDKAKHWNKISDDTNSHQITKKKKKNTNPPPPKKNPTEMRSVAVAFHLSVGAMNTIWKVVHVYSCCSQIAFLSGRKEQNKCTDI